MSTKIMGIMNITPDSFSDGGKYNAENALNYAEQMINDGADIIDIGGFSTRPGYSDVSLEEEIARVIPVVKALRPLDVLLSVDTFRSEVAQAALEAGADIINDQWAGKYDADMFDTVAQYNAQMILMHNNEVEITDNVMAHMLNDLQAQAKKAEAAGINKEDIWLDPGIGFAKSRAQEIEVMQRLDELAALGYKVLLATSRKRMLKELLDDNLPADQRDEGTAATTVWGIMKGIEGVRVHNVAMNKKAAKVADGLKGAR